MKLPPAKINEIAQDLQCGMRCLVHVQTGEIISILKEDDMDLSEDEENPWQEQIDRLQKSPMDFREIQPMPSYEAFKIMESFAENAPPALKARLFRALSQRKPFRHFQAEVDNAGDFREKWFAFRNEQWEKWVEEQLEA